MSIPVTTLSPASSQITLFLVYGAYFFIIMLFLLVLAIFCIMGIHESQTVTSAFSPEVMRSWRTIKLCCTCPLPLKLKTQRKTHSAPLLMPQVWLEPLRMRQLVVTKSRGSLLLRWARPKKRLALPPLNSRGCQVTVSPTRSSGSCLNWNMGWTLTDHAMKMSICTKQQHSPGITATNSSTQSV